MRKQKFPIQDMTGIFLSGILVFLVLPALCVPGFLENNLPIKMDPNLAMGILGGLFLHYLFRKTMLVVTSDSIAVQYYFFQLIPYRKKVYTDVFNHVFVERLRGSLNNGKRMADKYNVTLRGSGHQLVHLHQGTALARAQEIAESIAEACQFPVEYDEKVQADLEKK